MPTWPVSRFLVYTIFANPDPIKRVVDTSRQRAPSPLLSVSGKPQPNGEPGYIRVDTVHQGDLDKIKGVYHINALDEVTQFEVICSTQKISEQFLNPIFTQMFEQYPFVIKGFHADNGSEYINRAVAEMLNKLLIELTKTKSPTQQ